MRTPLHFYKAHCRLGLMNKPFGGTEFNYGVEHAPDVILHPEWLTTHFPDVPVDAFWFPKPEDIRPDRYLDTIAESSRAFAALIGQQSSPGDTSVVIGGDHSVTLASMLAVLQVHDPLTTGYIHLDSHADLMSFATTRSGNFHGMFLRGLIGEFDRTEITALLATPLPTNNILFIGNLELDPVEEAIISAKHLQHMDGLQLNVNHGAALTRLRAFASQFRHLHVSLDIDVFHRHVAHATGTPSSNGLTPAQLFPLLHSLSAAPSLSIDLTEVNPSKTGGAETVKLARDTLTALLGLLPSRP